MAKPKVRSRDSTDDIAMTDNIVYSTDGKVWSNMEWQDYVDKGGRKDAPWLKCSVCGAYGHRGIEH